MSSSAPGVSIIVPTYREAPNIDRLVSRIRDALRPTDRPAEIVLVDDDSQDGIEQCVKRLADGVPVRLIVRQGRRGLSAAVLTGFGEAKYDRFVVLDADLQHPPEAIPAMLDCLDENDHDFVIASRFCPGASIDTVWPVSRRVAALVARLLARPLAPLTDPLSGFFALRRSTWERAVDVKPIGYKIALELYVKARCRRPGEVPIRFGTRAAGKSKFGVAEQVRYTRHLLRLYRHRYPRLILVVPVVVLGAAVVAFLLSRTAAGTKP